MTLNAVHINEDFEDDEETRPLLTPEQDDDQRRDSKLKRFLGLLCACCSGACFTTMSFFFKSNHVNAVDFLVVRSFLQATGPAIIMACQCKKCWPSRSENSLWIYFLLFIYATMVGYIILGNVVTVSLLPLGDALTFLFTAPVFTAIVARFFFGTPVKGYKIFFIIILIIGALLLIRPPFIFDASATEGYIVHDFYYYIGVLIGLSVAFCIGTANNIVAAPLKHLPTTMVIFYTGIAGLVIALIACQFDNKHRIFSAEIVQISPSEWGLFIGLGILAIGALVFKLLALQLVEATTASVFRSVEIVLGYILQITVLKEHPDGLSIAGAVIVVISVLAMPFEQACIKIAPECVKKYL